MKKFLFTCLLALPVSAASQQQASAWFELDWQCGCNLHIAASCPCWNFCIGCSSPCAAPGCGYGAWDPGYAWGGYADPYSYGTVVSPAPTTTAPSAPVQKTAYPAAGYSGWGYQAVGYSEAPSYWYGR